MVLNSVVLVACLRTVQVHVLDPELLDKSIHAKYKSQHFKEGTWVEPPPELADITFQDINNKPLEFPDGARRPAKRCFLVHAMWALHLAKARGWVLDPKITTNPQSHGWQSPDFLVSRERTQLWVLQHAAAEMEAVHAPGSVGA